MGKQFVICRRSLLLYACHTRLAPPAAHQLASVGWSQPPSIVWNNHKNQPKNTEQSTTQHIDIERHTTSTYCCCRSYLLIPSTKRSRSYETHTTTHDKTSHQVVLVGARKISSFSSWIDTACARHYRQTRHKTQKNIYECIV